jgi:hypothetical protein
MKHNQDDPVRVFISYSHDSENHKDRVLNLADRLRSEGIDCHIDQYEMSPKGGWAQWMDRQIEDADFVLVVCTEKYQSRFSGKDTSSGGLGAKWEGAIITQDIYEAAGSSDKFIPVLFSPSDSQYRPRVLRPVTYYNVSTEDGYEDLYRRLTNQPLIAKPELGKRRSLPPRQRQQSFPATSQPSVPKKQAEARPQPLTQIEEKKTDYDSLVLLMNTKQQFQLISSTRIETDSVIRLHLAPSNPREIAFLSNLRNSHERSVAVAYGVDAFEARVESATQVRESGKEIWTVVLQESKDDYDSGYLEINFNNWSADDIAELRARRILLDESIGGSGTSSMDRLNAGMIEHYVRGKNNFIGDLHSPFPKLYEELRNNPPHFLAAARLFAVLYLRLSGVVRHVLRLDLKMQSDAQLAVRFEGERRQQYSNVLPHVIKVKGICPLLDEDEEDEE